jgi:hypothetical protein
MVDEVTTFQDGILLKTLAAPLMLPHFAYMSPHKDFRLTTTRSLSAHKLAHALIT